MKHGSHILSVNTVWYKLIFSHVNYYKYFAYQPVFVFIFIDIVLCNLHRTGVRDDRPTVGINAVQLLHVILGGNFTDVAEHRIPVRRHAAGEGNLNLL